MIYLFPLSYPYTIGKEFTFIADEVNKIQESFGNLVLFPSMINDEKYQYNKSVVLNNSLGDYLAGEFNLWQYLFSFRFIKLMYVELINKPQSFLNYHKLKSLTIYVLNTIRVFKWIQLNLLPEITKNSNTKYILYTYWFTHITTAICLAFSKFHNVKIITRAHGIDLYEFRSNNYLPLRAYTIKQLTKFYFVSEFGEHYCRQKYPQHSQKYITNALGVLAHGIINKIANDNTFHFVSCSNIDENKRVDIIFEALIVVASKNSNSKICWTHFGGGVQYPALKDMVSNLELPNLDISLKGSVESQEILDFYAVSQINAFITTSASEGGRPLSVQEALSFGIPVIATKVGGIPEIVNKQNGFLLSENPSIKEVSLVLNDVINNFDNWYKKREHSVITWKEKCDSDLLTNGFIQELRSL